MLICLSCHEGGEMQIPRPNRGMEYECGEPLWAVTPTLLNP